MRSRIDWEQVGIWAWSIALTAALFALLWMKVF
jgi:hypothetical protein